jgi:hypothetical protein
MLALLGILLGAAWYGWATITSADDDDEQPQARTEPRGPRCANSQVFKKGTTIQAKTITVNVFNAGLITGLAGETLDDLVDNGFRRGAAENAPTGITATNVTIITNTLNSPQVRLVARQFRGDVRVVEGDAIRPGINVVIGDNFRGVDDAARERLVVQRTVKTCTTTGAATGTGAS